MCLAAAGGLQHPRIRGLDEVKRGIGRGVSLASVGVTLFAQGRRRGPWGPAIGCRGCLQFSGDLPAGGPQGPTDVQRRKSQLSSIEPALEPIHQAGMNDCSKARLDERR